MPSHAEAEFIGIAATLDLYGIELYCASWVHADQEVGCHDNDLDTEVHNHSNAFLVAVEYADVIYNSVMS